MNPITIPTTARRLEFIAVWFVRIMTPLTLALTVIFDDWHLMIAFILFEVLVVIAEIINQACKGNIRLRKENKP